MQKILFIAQYFPPMGGIGVQRSLNFVNHLSQFSYEPVVLTISERDIIEAGYKLDLNPLEEVTKKGIRIIRVDSAQPHKFIRFLMKLRIFRFFWYLFYLFFWEKYPLWPIVAFRKARKIIRENNIKIVYTNSDPFSGMLLGYLLKITSDVKWIADNRDLNSDNYQWIWPSRIHWWVVRKLEPIFFRKADKFVVVSRGMYELYEKRNLFNKGQLVIIHSGF